jgi:PTH2 family peptidyl-tRNA hydrolase
LDMNQLVRSVNAGTLWFSPSWFIRRAQMHRGTAGLCLASLALGYYLGHRTTPTTAAHVPPKTDVTSEPQEESDSEDEDAIADGDLSAVQAGWIEPCKMVLVVRTDLNMSQGKIAAQCVLASLP